LLGALAGGWISDRLGRRKVFIGTMVMFIVLAIAQSFSVKCGCVRGPFLLALRWASDISSAIVHHGNHAARQA